MNRDYASLFPRVLEALYPDKVERARVMKVLSSYGAESYHREQDRVYLGVLKLVSAEPGMLEEYTQLACEDYRDLLCAAEYPLTSRRFGLREKDPKRYQKLEEKETREYDDWLSRALST